MTHVPNKNTQQSNKVAAKLRASRKKKFLEVFATCGVIGTACKAADVSRHFYIKQCKKDKEFKEACDMAFQNAIDIAENELRNRAVEGIEEIVLYKGEPVWRRSPTTGEIILDDDFEPIPFTIIKKSDKLLETYIKAHRPIYKDKSSVELSGPDGGPIDNKITVNYVLPKGKSVEDYDSKE